MNPNPRTRQFWIIAALAVFLLLMVGPWVILRFLSREHSVPGQTVPVSLEAHYDRLLETYSPSVSWGAVPIGTQTLAGVLFDVRGIAEVTGLGAARNGQFHPTSVRGIRVGRKAEQIHLLHGVGWDDKDGTPVARVILHYAGGGQCAFDLAYGVHVRNWWIERSEKTNALSDPHSEVAWTGTSPDTDRFRVTLRLFKTTLANPRPDQEIASLDFVSLFSRAIPVLLALSVEPQALKPDAKIPVPPFTPESSNGEDNATMVRVLDVDSGQPLPGAIAWLQVCENTSCYGFGQWRGDRQGQIRLEFPKQRATAASLLVVARGHEPEKFDLGPESSQTLKLKPGAVGGGLVQDESGQPVSGALVSIRGTHRTPRGVPQEIEFDQVTTDAAGRWSSRSLPTDPRRLLFAVTLTNFLPTHYTVWRARTKSEFPVRMTQEDSSSNHAVMVLGRSIVGNGHLEITASDTWQDTGITLQEDQRFSALAFGLWSHGKEDSVQAYYGPEGFARSSARTLLPSSPIGTLIGRIGERGRLFAIEQGESQRANASGSLWLILNDAPASAQDNRGALEVVVQTFSAR